MNPPDNLPPPTSALGLARRIIWRLRYGGIGWLTTRSKQEIRAPQTAPGRVINAWLRRFVDARRRIHRLNAPAHSQRGSTPLLAVYDTLVEPTTFDVLIFLLRAELERRRSGAAQIHVLFVSSPDGETREEADAYRAVVSASSQRDRIVNMLIPAAWQLPAVSAVSSIGDREEVGRLVDNWPAALLFPPRYSTRLQQQTSMRCYREVFNRDNTTDDIAAFRASASSNQYVRRWLAGHNVTGPFVAITLRTYSYNTARNSNLKNWRAAARYVQEKGYTPIIVPDTESLVDGVPAALADVLRMPEAAWNVGIRLALYEQAFVNMGVSSGPLMLAMLDSRCRALMFKILTPEIAQCTEEYLRQQGFIIGGQIPFCTPLQKQVWRDDSYEAIVEEFDAFERLTKTAATI